MDTINERIKFVRKHFKLSQVEFAEKLGISQRSVSWNEHAGNNVSTSTIKSICMAYSINENWLRTGEGKMFLQSSQFILDQYVYDHGGTELDLEIVKAYFSIPAEIRQIVLDCVKNVFSAQTASEPTVEDLEAEYKKMLSGLASSRESSASNITDENISTQTSEG